MRARSFRAMGTGWWVACDRTELMDGVPQQVDVLEDRLSRFRPTSALSRLNRDRTVEDPVLAEVVSLALQMRERTSGAFDPTLGGVLVALGYDRDFRVLGPAVAVHPVPTGRLGVTVDGDRVDLDGKGDLDLGGIAKGWAVDRIHRRRGRARHRPAGRGRGDLVDPGQAVALR